MWRQWLPALRLTIVMSVLTGLIYPAVTTVLAQWAFADRANGSLLRSEGRLIGSSLIGQGFVRPEYFHPRPSAAGNGYDPESSGGSNLGPTSAKLSGRVKQGVAHYRAENPDFHGAVPPDSVTASGSGLDPHITPANAETQSARVAAARGVTPAQVLELLARYVEQRDWGLLGEPRVNVLKLNLALDARYPMRH